MIGMSDLSQHAFSVRTLFVVPTLHVITRKLRGHSLHGTFRASQERVGLRLMYKQFWRGTGPLSVSLDLSENATIFMATKQCRLLFDRNKTLHFESGCGYTHAKAKREMEQGIKKQKRARYQGNRGKQEKGVGARKVQGTKTTEHGSWKGEAGNEGTKTMQREEQETCKVEKRKSERTRRQQESTRTRDPKANV